MDYNTDLIREGILEAADELQMDPAVLTTIISYETAGTFDPRKAGPRAYSTEGGQPFHAKAGSYSTASWAAIPRVGQCDRRVSWGQA